MAIDEKTYEALRFTRAGRVLTITMDTGDGVNAVTETLHREFASVFHDAADDPESDVIVLTGAGRAFCAGGDLKWLLDEVKNGPPPFVADAHVMRRIVGGLLECPKPVIAKVNGDAMGFGASVALLSDIVIAARSARFADPHTKIGLSAGDGGALIWPQLIGYAKAKHYLLTGEPIGAEEAERIGLITFAVDDGELDGFVTQYAERLARGAQTAIRYTKTTANIPLRQMAATLYEAGVAYEGLCKHTADYAEGVRAFSEKRRPRFTGK